MRSTNPFATAIIAGIYANKAKHDDEKRYIFKRRLMQQVLKKFSKHESARTYLTALFYFIDYLLKIPDKYKKQLKGDIMPYLGKEVREKMQAEKMNPSQTLEEIFKELRQEGMERGRREALKPVVQGLIEEGFTNQQIANITKLSTEEVERLIQLIN